MILPNIYTEYLNYLHRISTRISTLSIHYPHHPIVVISLFFPIILNSHNIHFIYSYTWGLLSFNTDDEFNKIVCNAIFDIWIQLSIHSFYFELWCEAFRTFIYYFSYFVGCINICECEYCTKMRQYIVRRWIK